MTEFERDMKAGATFWLGPVLQSLEIGEYQFIKYQAFSFDRSEPKLTDDIMYSAYINGRCTRNSYGSLDKALVGTIAHQHDGLNSQAAGYFYRMIGIEDQQETVPPADSIPPSGEPVEREWQAYHERGGW